MKIKLINMLRGKEKNTRKTNYAKLEVDEEDLNTSQINSKGKRAVGKASKRINVEKI